MNESTAVVQSRGWTTRSVAVVAMGALTAAFVIGYLYGPLMFGKR